MDTAQLFSLAIFIIMGIIGALMSEKRHRNKVGGFILGFFLGLIGIAIIAVAGEKKIEETKESDIQL